MLSPKLQLARVTLEQRMKWDTEDIRLDLAGLIKDLRMYASRLEMHLKETEDTPQNTVCYADTQLQFLNGKVKAVTDTVKKTYESHRAIYNAMNTYESTENE